MLSFQSFKCLLITSTTSCSPIVASILFCSRFGNQFIIDISVSVNHFSYSLFFQRQSHHPITVITSINCFSIHWITSHSSVNIDRKLSNLLVDFNVLYFPINSHTLDSSISQTLPNKRVSKFSILFTLDSAFLTSDTLLLLFTHIAFVICTADVTSHNLIALYNERLSIVSSFVVLVILSNISEDVFQSIGRFDILFDKKSLAILSKYCFFAHNNHIKKS